MEENFKYWNRITLGTLIMICISRSQPSCLPPSESHKAIVFPSAWWLWHFLSCLASPASWPAPCQQFALSLLVISQFFFFSVSFWLYSFLSACSFSPNFPFIYPSKTSLSSLFKAMLGCQVWEEVFPPPYYHDHDLVSKAECSAVAFTIDLFKAHMWINTE